MDKKNLLLMKDVPSLIWKNTLSPTEERCTTFRVYRVIIAYTQVMTTTATHQPEKPQQWFGLLRKFSFFVFFVLLLGVIPRFSLLLYRYSSTEVYFQQFFDKWTKLGPFIPVCLLYPQLHLKLNEKPSGQANQPHFW